MSSALRNTRPRPVCTLVAVMNSFIGACDKRLKSMQSAKISRQRVDPTRIEIVGREHARHEVEGKEQR